MKLPTCLWMLGAGVFPSVTSAHAQRFEDIIELNAEFNENGDLVVTADKKWIGTYSSRICQRNQFGCTPTLSGNGTFQWPIDYVEKQRVIYLYPMWMAVYARFGRLARKA